MDLDEELYIEIDPRSHLEVADSKHRYAKNLRYYFQEFARLMGTVGMSPHPPSDAPTSSSLASENSGANATTAGDDTVSQPLRFPCFEGSTVSGNNVSPVDQPKSVITSISVPCLTLSHPDKVAPSPCADEERLLRAWKMLAAPSPRSDAVFDGSDSRLKLHSDRIMEIICARRRSDSSHHRRSKSAPPCDLRGSNDSPDSSVTKTGGTKNEGRPHSLGGSGREEGLSATVSIDKKDYPKSLTSGSADPAENSERIKKCAASKNIEFADDAYVIGEDLGDNDSGTEEMKPVEESSANLLASAEDCSWKWDHFNAFFEWLDGDSKPELEVCPRENLQKDTVMYLYTDETRLPYAIKIDQEGLLRRVMEPQEVITTGQEGWIFVAKNDVIYGHLKKTKPAPRIHHSTFLAGEAVEAAGLFVTQDGRLTRLYPHSGHYRPAEIHLCRLLEFLQRQGVQLQTVEVDIQRVMRIARLMHSDGAKKKKVEGASFQDGLSLLHFLQMKQKLRVMDFHRLIAQGAKAMRYRRVRRLLKHHNRIRKALNAAAHTVIARAEEREHSQNTPHTPHHNHNHNHHSPSRPLPDDPQLQRSAPHQLSHKGGDEVEVVTPCSSGKSSVVNSYDSEAFREAMTKAGITEDNLMALTGDHFAAGSSDHIDYDHMIAGTGVAPSSDHSALDDITKHLIEFRRTHSRAASWGALSDDSSGHSDLSGSGSNLKAAVVVGSDHGTANTSGSGGGGPPPPTTVVAGSPCRLRMSSLSKMLRGYGLRFSDQDLGDAGEVGLLRKRALSSPVIDPAHSRTHGEVTVGESLPVTVPVRAPPPVIVGADSGSKQGIRTPRRDRSKSQDDFEEGDGKHYSSANTSSPSRLSSACGTSTELRARKLLSLLYSPGKKKEKEEHEGSRSPADVSDFPLTADHVPVTTSASVSGKEGQGPQFRKNLSAGSSPTASTSNDSDLDKLTEGDTHLPGDSLSTSSSSMFLNLKLPNDPDANGAGAGAGSSYDFLRSSASSGKSPHPGELRRSYSDLDEPWLSPHGHRTAAAASFYKDLQGDEAKLLSNVSPMTFRRAFEEQLDLVESESDDDDDRAGFEGEGRLFYGDLDDVICGDLGRVEGDDGESDYPGASGVGGTVSGFSSHGGRDTSHSHNHSGKDTNYAVNLLLSESPPNN